MDLSPSDVTTAVVSSFQASDITAIAGVVVALCALFATIWQARKSHLHSIVSVKPVLEVHFLNNENPIENEFELFILFSNVGLGPAQIISWRYFLEDKEVHYNRMQTINYTTQTFHKAFSSLPVKPLSAMGKVKGNIIKEGYSETLLHVVTSFDSKEIILKRFEDIRLVIEYTDMYGNPQKPLDTKEDDN